jgi:peptidoglycan/xylan/chitin deacetylase (PgdA/CDA1 family)
MKQTVKKNKPLVLALLIIAGLFLFSRQKPAATPPAQTPTNPVVNAIQSLPADQKPVVQTSIQAPILMYHHVGDSLNTESDLTVSSKEFETQVQYFQDLGYTSVSLAEVYNAVELGGVLPAHPIVFTFDDGYKDVFTYAVPILQKHGFIGTFAIATELLGRPGYAVWDDVIAAQKMGMEIVSHSENHLDLTNSIYSDVDLRREIFDSKTLLEHALGVPIDFFVYPYGRYNAKVEQMVKDAGYKLALTTAYGIYVSPSSLFETSRVRVHGQDGLEKLKKVFEKSPRIAPAVPNL